MGETDNMQKCAIWDIRNSIEVRNTKVLKCLVRNGDGDLAPNGQLLKIPEVEKFYYPYVEGMKDKELQNKVNDTIKNAIFTEEFLSDRLSAVGVETTQLLYFEYPGIISNNDILSILLYCIGTVHIAIIRLSCKVFMLSILILVFTMRKLLC